jgi:prepilin-type N-terminal cleavage/methylation domain-containing protein
MKLQKVGVPASQRAFTLIELLTVIAIIAVLAALILGVSGFVQEKAGNSRATTEIQALSLALESYKQDNGTYPKGIPTSDLTGDRSTKILMDALDPVGGSPNDYNSTGKIYFEIPPKMLDGYSSKKSADENRRNADFLVDPFGNSYHYYFDPDAAAAGTATDNPVTHSQNNGPQFFDLWSYGKNPQKNQNNPASWIKNW